MIKNQINAMEGSHLGFGQILKHDLSKKGNLLGSYQEDHGSNRESKDSLEAGQEVLDHQSAASLRYSAQLSKPQGRD